MTTLGGRIERTAQSLVKLVKPLVKLAKSLVKLAESLVKPTKSLVELETGMAALCERIERPRPRPARP